MGLGWRRTIVALPLFPHRVAESEARKKELPHALLCFPDGRTIVIGKENKNVWVECIDNATFKH